MDGLRRGGRLRTRFFDTVVSILLTDTESRVLDFVPLLKILRILKEYRSEELDLVESTASEDELLYGGLGLTRP